MYYYYEVWYGGVMENADMELLSKYQLQLQIELIINRKLYDSKKIMKDTYLRIEQDILRDLKHKTKAN